MLARAVSSQPSRTLIRCRERCTQQWLPRLAVQPASAAIQSLTPARRSYATKKVLRRSPTVVRAERAAERSRTPALAANTQDSDLYDPASVPPLDYFENAAVVVPTGFLSPQEARDLILQYITVMLKEKDRLPWKAILQGETRTSCLPCNPSVLLTNSTRARATQKTTPPQRPCTTQHASSSPPRACLSSGSSACTCSTSPRSRATSPPP